MANGINLLVFINAYMAGAYSLAACLTPVHLLRCYVQHTFYLLIIERHILNFFSFQGKESHFRWLRWTERAPTLYELFDLPPSSSV